VFDLIKLSLRALNRGTHTNDKLFT
jgi:hypothetical protein